ncbi:MAG: Fic family protein [Actinomycetota bacterium]
MKDFVAGKYINQGFYKSFQPGLINRQWTLDDMEVIQLLSRADREPGRLDMYSDYIPDIDLFISMHVLKEATQSSRIEGTHTNIEEALKEREDIPPDKRDDWEEVQNYSFAMQAAIRELDNLPLSSRLIRETHKRLLQGVRGEKKMPGEFRRSQNWIGGASINDALFIPPVHTAVPELMSDLEHFIHNREVFFPELLKIALIHYQFETIHPFLDGNGRIGRLLITLCLVSKGILKKPLLYISDFMETHRDNYYRNLMTVRTDNNISRWFKFFLTGVIDTAEKGIRTFDSILQLQRQMDQRIQTLGRSLANAQKVMDYLYHKPLINAVTVSEITGISSPSAYRLVSNLEQLGVLKEITGGKRKREYLFADYLNLFR